MAQRLRPRQGRSRALPLGWHPRVHAVGEEWFELKTLLSKPKISIVIDHMGHPEVKGGVDHPTMRFLRDMLKRENWWVMISNADRVTAQAEVWDDDVAPIARRQARASTLITWMRRGNSYGG